MQTLQEYLSDSPISRATLFNHIKAGKIKTTKIKGKLYIITGSQQTPFIKAETGGYDELLNAKKSGRKQAWLATNIELSAPYLNMILKGKKEPSDLPDLLTQIEKILKIN